MAITIDDIRRVLQAQVLAGEGNLVAEVGFAIASDLVSDILLCTDERVFVITGLAKIQLVRAADMIDLIGVCFVRGKEPDEAVVHYAREIGLPLLTTTRTMYESCGLVYQLGAQAGTYAPPRGLTS